MKILVDEMPTRAEDCPWSSPVKDIWNDRMFWFCNWSSKDSQEICSLVRGDKCPYFTTINERN